MNNKLSQYFNNLNSYFNLNKILMNSSITSVLLIWLDYKNIISQFWNTIFGRFMTGFVFVIILLLFLLNNKRLIYLLKNQVMSEIDSVLITIGFNLVTLLLFRIASSNYLNYTSLSIVIFLLAFFGLLCFRIIKIDIDSKNKPTQSITIDLLQVINKEIDYENNFILSEDAVEYDLLNREPIVHELKDLLKNYNSEERLVIGIEGKWGSGKSTVINNLSTEIRENSEILIIDEFNPWMYENNTALFKGLLDKVFDKETFDISSEELTKIKKSFISLVFGESLNSLYNLMNENKYDEKILLKRINNYLNKNNQKMVLIIDNLDRLSSDQIVLILSFVHNVLSGIENFIIIFAYDRQELNNILLSENISKNYLSKLIQKRIILPVPNKSRMIKITVQSITNILEGYNIQYSGPDLKAIGEYLINAGLDLRELKRIINSIILPLRDFTTHKFFTDYFILELTKYFDYELYLEMYNQPNMFITYDSNEFIWDKEKNNEENKIYFEEISGRHKDYFSLLKLAFPKIKRYLNGTDPSLHGSFTRQDSEYKEAHKNKRMHSADFYTMYFNFSLTKEAELSDKINKLLIVDTLEKSNIDEAIKYIYSLNAEEQNYSLMHLEYIDQDILTGNRIYFIEGLLNKIDFIADESPFFGISNRHRVVILTSELLLAIQDKEDVQLFLKENLSKVNNISDLSQLMKWIKNSEDRFVENNNITDIVKEHLDDIITDIVNKKENIFLYNLQDSIIHSIYRHYQNEKKNLNEFKEYLRGMYNENTLYKILNEFIFYSTDGTLFNYYVSDVFDEVNDVAMVFELIKQTDPVDEKQELIKEIYTQTKNENFIHSDINLRVVMTLDYNFKVDE